VPIAPSPGPPPAAYHPSTESVPTFSGLPIADPQVFSAVGVQKSEHFWTPDGEAAGGFLRGARFARSAPLGLLLLVLFLQEQEKNEENDGKINDHCGYRL